MSTALEAFRAEVLGQLGGLTGAAYVRAHPGAHVWAAYRGMDSCAFCGVVRRRDDGNSPCRGIVRVEPRGAA